MPKGPQQIRKKVREVSERGGGSPEKRPHDASRGQKRY